MGRPDRQGVWNHGTIAPLERLEEYDGELLTAEEDAALNQRSDTRAEREGLFKPTYQAAGPH